VKAGETLYGIARFYGYSYENTTNWNNIKNSLEFHRVLGIAELNNLKPPYTLEVGQRLLVKNISEKIAKSKANTIISQSTKVNIPSQQIITDITPPKIIIHNKTRGPENTLTQDNQIISGQAIDESGIFSITVNNQNTRFNQQGHFSAELQLRVGNNDIKITATDKRNNTSHKTITLARAEPYKSIFTGNYHALVIGINQYQNITNLSTAVNDAREVTQILKNQYGFQVTTLINEQATRSKIIRA